MPKIKDLTLSFDSRMDDTLTGKVIVVNQLAKSEKLEGMTFILSAQPKREITFLFPPGLADDEDFTGTVIFPPKHVAEIRPIAPLEANPVVYQEIEVAPIAKVKRQKAK